MLLETRSLKQNGAYLQSTNTLTVLSTYTTLAWAFKSAARCLTSILPGQYQDIARAISWESGLPMTLIPSQFKESMRFDSLY